WQARRLADAMQVTDWTTIEREYNTTARALAHLARTTKVPMEWKAFGLSEAQRKWDVTKSKAAADVAKFLSDRLPAGPIQQDGDPV
ncbi:hypothetical protein PF010_g33285, partial [Phytophthora fragariae]